MRIDVTSHFDKHGNLYASLDAHQDTRTHSHTAVPMPSCMSNFMSPMKFACLCLCQDTCQNMCQASCHNNCQHIFVSAYLRMKSHMNGNACQDGDRSKHMTTVVNLAGWDMLDVLAKPRCERLKLNPFGQVSDWVLSTDTREDMGHWNLHLRTESGKKCWQEA